MKKHLSVVLISFALTGCFLNTGLNSAITNHHSELPKIKLGDSQYEVLSILSPTESALKEKYKRSPEKFYNDGKEVEIYFFRVARPVAGVSADDQFTPYIFVDKKLVGIGWSMLGGPKSLSPESSDTIIIQNNHPGQDRAAQQILNHGAGGCTPNFSTGGCL